MVQNRGHLLNQLNQLNHLLLSIIELCVANCYQFMLNIKRTDGIRKDRTLDTRNRRRNLADLLIQR